jgi:hypothetical protein
MNTIYRKSHVVKTYSLIFLETIGVALSYFIALLLRFEDYTFDNHFDMYVNYGVFLLVLTLLYSIVTDWNRDFFERGFFKEMWAVGKYDIIITVLSTTFLFFTKDAYDFSRLVFVYFAIGNLISTIVNDTRKILTVSTYLEGEVEGVYDVSLGVPVVLCKNGIQRIIPVHMKDEEKAEFFDAARTVKKCTYKIRDLLDES